MGSAARADESNERDSEFCFAYPQMFVIPIEYLSRTGMSSSFARLLQRKRGVSAEWVELFDRALARYFDRISVLAERAPEYWRAPRLAHVCIVQQPDRTRPYYQPFPKTSWLLYESDFDPERSTVEHSVYQLAHVERLGLIGDPGMAWIHNLSYFILRSAEERAAFVEGCEASPRPDAEAFRALARLIDLVDCLYHDQLRPGLPSSEVPTARIEAAGLNVPEEHQSAFQMVAKTFRAAAQRVMQRHYETQGSLERHHQPEQALLRWLEETQPRVILTDHLGGTLWDPERAEQVEGLRTVLEGIPSRAAESLKEDWSLIDRHSRGFVAALVDPNELRPPKEALDQEDGIYLHAERPLIAYCLAQPGLRTLAEEAPPYHRMLVGARTIHEWGHLAVDAGMVAVPDCHKASHEQAHRKLLELFDEIVAAAPEHQRSEAEVEVGRLAREGYRLGDMPLQRAADYQANLLARLFLTRAEMEAYVRANVRPLIDEKAIGPYLRLARHAYEYQYLLLSDIKDPFRYFVSSTWFGEDFFETGIITEALARELFAAVTLLFDGYQIDTTRIRPQRIALSQAESRLDGNS